MKRLISVLPVIRKNVPRLDPGTSLVPGDMLFFGGSGRVWLVVSVLKRDLIVVLAGDCIIKEVSRSSLSDYYRCDLVARFKSGLPQ